MNQRQPDLKYQNASVQSAGPLGLVILLYDRLVRDLADTAEAIRKNDIEGRCQAGNHALQVLQHLEASLDMVNGGETALALARIYAHIRCKVLEVQFKHDPQILAQQIEMIVDLRQAWDRADSPVADAPAVVVASQPDKERATSSWSA
jgi:flagellar protein FliS